MSRKLASSEARASSPMQRAAISATIGSTTRRSPKSSRTKWSGGEMALCQLRTAGSSRLHASVSRTRVPNRAFVSSNPLLARTRTASRSTLRLTPSCSQRSASFGNVSPGLRRPATTSWPILCTTRPTSPTLPIFVDIPFGDITAFPRTRSKETRPGRLALGSALSWTGLQPMRQHLSRQSPPQTGP